MGATWVRLEGATSCEMATNGGNSIVRVSLGGFTSSAPRSPTRACAGYAATNRSRVISAGTPKRFGGPQ
jgi:hypothetical protein